MTRRGRNEEFVEVAKDGCAFRGVIRPTGPKGEYKTVLMYVAVASSLEAHDDRGVITADCCTPEELSDELDVLKCDLDWVYRGLQRKLKKLRRTGK